MNSPETLPSPEGDRSSFRGFENLLGSDRYRLIEQASVCIIGLGGVGSWTAEGLARSGIGALTLVDLDDVCITNINRQVQALHTTLGHSKSAALAARLLDINPKIRVDVIDRYFSSSSAASILDRNFDVVVDGIDRVTNKCLLISLCRERGIPLVTTGSAGERLDPTTIRVVDLARTEHDPLLAYVRKRLRQQHGFPRWEGKKFGIPCVFAPLTTPPPAREGTCVTPPPADVERSDGDFPGKRRHWFRSCNEGLGSAGFVTGAFGFAAAAEVVKILLSPKAFSTDESSI